MANKALFKTQRGRYLPAADTINEAGGLAYQLAPDHALAQFAATGCLNDTFYASDGEQLDTVLSLCNQVEPEFIARTALYSRRKGYMKDLPALLAAILTVRGPELLPVIFSRVIDNPRMLRNFVLMVRSGVVGRKSLGSLPKRLIREWLAERSDEQLFVGAIGGNPSLVDVVKMVHPKPATASREALYGYLIGRSYDAEALPEIVKAFEKFKRNTNPGKVPIPDVPFQYLTSLPLTARDWKQIARNASWQMTRMNLNTFLRHGVFEDKEMINIVAQRLRDPRLIRQAKVFPYQLLVAYRNADRQVPNKLRDALQDALEIATQNVPKFDGQIYVLPDVSGSMHCPVTGYRRGSTSAVRCIDVAALVAAALVRANPSTEVIPFESVAIPPERAGLNSRDSVMTNAEKLARLPAGGTNCSAPLQWLNKQKRQGDLVIYVSDNESWIDTPHYGRCGGSATETLKAWEQFKQRSPLARMICIDIQPYGTTQATDRDDIINVGGFSDQVFRLIGAVARGEARGGYWVRQIQALEL